MVWLSVIAIRIPPSEPFQGFSPFAGPVIRSTWASRIGVTLSCYPPRSPRFPALAPGTGDQSGKRHTNEEKAAKIGYRLYVLQMHDAMARTLAFFHFKRDGPGSRDHRFGYRTG
jgi:hypothetical protein